MPRAPREESSDSTHFSAKRQRDRRSQLSNSMRARLGPQEPGRPRPPVATTWAPRPDPMVTPVGQNMHPHPPKGIPRTEVFHIRWDQRSLRSHHALSVAYDARYWQRCATVQSVPRQPTRADPLMVSSPTFQLCWQFQGPVRSFRGTILNIKMQDNESLREFVKRFGQAVLQVEACSMDAVLQIFKQSICPDTPFFESLAKKPPTTMDDLFRLANKYSMLEDDVRVATQQVLVAGRPSRGDAERNAKPPDRPRPFDRRQEGLSRPERPTLTPLSISYEKLLLMIQGLSDFRDHSKRCVFHKEHGHTTETCRSLQYLVEKLIKAGHLKQYLRSDTEGKVTSQHHNPGAPRAPAAPKAVINYINGGPSDEEYDSRRILVDPSISADLVQASVIGHMGHSLTCLENPGRILSGFNGSSTTSLGDIVLPVQAGPITLNVQFSVVQELSPFNIILGRTWLHYMKAIPSTYHQMVSFLTNEGQIDLYGSQLAARQCYQIAREVGANQRMHLPLNPAIHMTNSNY
uniref:Retrotransposon gag domain-containing protein n=1 Tax=Vitis vinifera TaxID=29760 RepID=A5BC31_VITVI|nr:hypothetical protein VITISV_042652 [Vitis vinifera]